MKKTTTIETASAASTRVLNSMERVVYTQHVIRCHKCGHTDEFNEGDSMDAATWFQMIKNMSEQEARIVELEAQLAFQGELLNSYKDAADTISGRAKRLQSERDRFKGLLDLHRRFHEKVGCPGAKDCYACEADSVDALKQREKETS